MIAGGPGFKYYEKARECLDVVEGRSRISAIVADQIGQQALLDTDFMERAKDRLLGDLVQKQENIEAIAAKAQAKIEEIPDADATVDTDSPEPSEDWFNAFTRQAELASSDELRDRLASVLAGEARNPGTFSRTTVRLIAEVEKEVLESFQQVLAHRVGDAIVRDDDWSSGIWFSKAVELEANGLVTGSEGFTHRRMRIGDNGAGFLIGQKASLAVIGKPGTEQQVSILLITRVGQELASLLSPTDEFVSLKRAGLLLKGKDGIDQIWMGPHRKTDADQFEVVRALLVWDREHDAAEVKAE